MFVTLTNAHPLHRGNPIAIKRDLIVTVYSNTQVREDGSIDDVTFIFVPPHATWEVLEKYDEILDMLNDTTG